jgi:integrase
METVEEINQGKPEKGLSWEGMIRKHFPEKAIPRYEKVKDRPGLFRYVGKNGISYGIDFYDSAGRKHREVTGPSLTEAKRRLEEAHGKVRRGDYIGSIKKFTFVELVTRFKEIKEGSGNSYYMNTEKYYLPILSDFFGTMRLCQISPYDIERFKKTRMETPKRYGGTRSTTTANRELACLQGLFSKAVTWAMLERNPFDKFKESVFFPENASRVRYLETNEIGKLLENCPDYLRVIVLTALYTGLRKSDVLSLRWENINLEAGVLTYFEKKKHNRKVTKTLNSDMLVVLQKIPAKTDGFVFHGPNGEATLKDVCRSFKSALRKSGIKDFRFHDLRHTSASYMVMRGASMKAVQAHLGHSSMSMSEKYSHLSPAYLKAEVEKLNGAFLEDAKSKELVRNDGSVKNEMQPTIEVSA